MEAAQADAIEKLKELRSALSELIGLAEAGQSLSDRLAALRRLKGQALKWCVSPYGLSLGGLPLVGSSTVLGAGVMYLVNAISPGDGAELGAAAAGAHVAVAVIRGTQARPA